MKEGYPEDTKMVKRQVRRCPCAWHSSKTNLLPLKTQALGHVSGPFVREGKGIAIKYILKDSKVFLYHSEIKTILDVLKDFRMGGEVGRICQAFQYTSVISRDKGVVKK